MYSTESNTEVVMGNNYNACKLGCLGNGMRLIAEGTTE